MRILLSKINNLGDAISFLPTIAAIRHRYPDAEISVLCTDRTASIIERSVPAIRAVSVGSYADARGRKALGRLPRLLGALGPSGYDWALLSHDEPKLAILVAAALFARRRVGFDLVNGSLQSFLSDVIPFHQSRNIVDINFDLVRLLTGDPVLAPRRTPIGYDGADSAMADERLAALGVEGRYVMLHPFASKAYKQWGLGSYRHVADRIRNEFGIPAIFLAEKNTAELAGMPVISGLTIHGLAALLSRAQLYIGNNSGPMHIAAAMSTPTIVIQGPSPPIWDVYWTDARHERLLVSDLPCRPCERPGYVPGRCINTEAPSACMTGITPDMVIGKVRHIFRVD